MPESYRLLLVPAFTELGWSIRPRLEEWAEVAIREFCETVANESGGE